MLILSCGHQQFGNFIVHKHLPSTLPDLSREYKNEIMPYIIKEFGVYPHVDFRKSKLKNDAFVNHLENFHIAVDYMKSLDLEGRILETFSSDWIDHMECEGYAITDLYNRHHDVYLKFIKKFTWDDLTSFRLIGIKGNKIFSSGDELIQEIKEKVKKHQGFDIEPVGKSIFYSLYYLKNESGLSYTEDENVAFEWMLNNRLKKLERQRYKVDVNDVEWFERRNINYDNFIQDFTKHAQKENI